MKNMLKNFIRIGLSTSLLFVAVSAPVNAQTPPPTPTTSSRTSVCEGVGLAGGGGNNCANPTDSPTVEGVIGTVINILSIVVGVVSVIMIIIGGLKYITSGGDSNSITSAKNTILYAIIGLVIVALAQVIVRFVLVRVAPG